MQKRKVHHLAARFKKIKPVYFLILTLISLAICIYALRSNNEQMIKLRAEVYAADQNNGDISGALKNLQAYVTSHMNTNLSTGPNAVYPPIQLENTYKRLVEQQGQQTTSENTQLYSDAENYCQAQVPTGFSGRYRIPCIENYINTHNLKQVSVDQSLYEFDFVSPSWSPDLAGWSVLITIFFGVCFLASLGYSWWYKRNLA
ncbi:MAG TPA: hypothetical protein VIH90_02510 [Candidatus Saccharimonadales bacterium]